MTKLIFHPIIENNLTEIIEIQQSAYSGDFLESPAVLWKKSSYNPQLSFLVQDKESQIFCGYLISYPAASNHVSCFNRATPPGRSADSWYIHDLAVRQSFAGRQIGRSIYEYVQKQARALKLTQTHLVAVQGASKFWQKFGYNQWLNAPEEVNATVNSYGSTAILMHSALPF